MPGWLKPIVGRLIAVSRGPRTAEIFRASGPMSAHGLWQLMGWRQRYVEQFAERLSRGGFDALLTPPFAVAALPHGSSLEMLAAASYSILPNLLDFPAGVVAATRVREHEESDRAATGDRTETRRPPDRARQRRPAGGRSGDRSAVAGRCRVGYHGGAGRAFSPARRLSVAIAESCFAAPIRCGRAPRMTSPVRSVFRLPPRALGFHCLVFVFPFRRDRP